MLFLALTPSRVCCKCPLGPGVRAQSTHLHLLPNRKSVNKLLQGWVIHWRAHRAVLGGHSWGFLGWAGGQLCPRLAHQWVHLPAVRTSALGLFPQHPAIPSAPLRHRMADGWQRGQPGAFLHLCLLQSRWGLQPGEPGGAVCLQGNTDVRCQLLGFTSSWDVEPGVELGRLS